MSNELKLYTFIAIGLLILFVFLVGQAILSRRKKEKLVSALTPITSEGLKQYDELPPGVAVALAWSEPGDFPRWHSKMQDEVRDRMPVLARALDRMVETNS